MRDQVWVLGATGRTGRAIARRLHDAGVPLVLVGRDPRRLAAAGAELGDAPRLLAGPLASVLAGLPADRPGVVVNTVGPFTTSAADVIDACSPATHYVDVSNEHASVERVLALNGRAAAAGHILVTGAGFGVVATESVVLRLCADQPPAARARVDALPVIALEAGVVGTALAGTIVQVLASGGREVRHGRLVPTRTAAHNLRLTTPDGDELTTASGANGELLAAWRASGADDVVAASSAAPSNAVLRSLLPAVQALLRLPGASRLAVTGMARIPLHAQPMARPSSWAHARVEWASGTVREGWLRVGDGTDFTASVTTDVTRRLLAGQGRPGAHTPAALFGPELAEAAGGEFLIDDPPRAAA